MTENAKDIKVDFTVFLSGLVAEGLASLGLLKHPAAEGIKKDLRHAGLVVDTLDMIKNKTKGNLTKEEEESLEQALHQLRMAYVSATQEDQKKEEKPQEEKQEEDKKNEN